MCERLPASTVSNTRLHAADLVLWSDIMDANDACVLQPNLRRIEDWCNQCLMHVNASKSECVSFSRAMSPTTRSYTLNNVTLVNVSHHGCLGVHLTRTRTKDAHITENANQTLGCLKPVLALTSTDITFLAYFTSAYSKLEFEPVICNRCQRHLVHQLENIQSVLLTGNTTTIVLARAGTSRIFSF